jgi:hypothetical protein
MFDTWNIFLKLKIKIYKNLVFVKISVGFILFFLSQKKIQ